jgi:hypothetical protein
MGIGRAVSAAVIGECGARRYARLGAHDIHM